VATPVVLVALHPPVGLAASVAAAAAVELVAVGLVVMAMRVLVAAEAAVKAASPNAGGE
jgi:hypothetical protein